MDAIAQDTPLARPARLPGAVRLLLDLYGPVVAAEILCDRLGWDVALTTLAALGTDAAGAAMWSAVEDLAAEAVGAL